MGCVNTESEPKFGTTVFDLAQMFEAIADACTLACGVFQQNAQPPEIETSAGDLQTTGAGFYPIGGAGAARAARVHYEIVRPEQNRALDLFAKRGARFLQDRFLGRGEIDQIVAVNCYRPQPCLAPHDH